jgi:hypothetical protein
MENMVNYLEKLAFFKNIFVKFQAFFCLQCESGKKKAIDQYKVSIASHRSLVFSKNITIWRHYKRV